ncbi:MAG TPA: ArsA family ATPase, partial [Candidatus Limnocylindrales bacterium]
DERVETVTRILLYTGKGGVGKTSIAAATAVLSAQRGIRTLVVSTDIAHSLADALDMPVGPTPRQITDNLWAHEPDVFFNISRYWRTIQSYFSSLFAWGGLDEVMAEEMTVLPGMDELGNLLWITDHVDSGKYDVVVVDAAPTGETLRLLSLPDASRWWIERIAPIGRRMTKLGRPMLERVLGVPIPRDEVFAAAERLLDRLADVHRLLSDPDQTSVRITLALDKLSVAEARRSFTYFHLFGYPSDMVIANRVLPAGSGPYFAELRKAQQGYLPIVEQEFGPVPVRTVPQFDHEMVGPDRLREIGAALFGDGDPTAVHYRGEPYRVTRENGSYVLQVELPFTERGEMQLSRRSDELVLQVGGWRRTLLLPRALMNAPTRGAKMDDGMLRIQFEAPAKTSQRGGRS